jgi:hypothetical protein
MRMKVKYILIGLKKIINFRMQRLADKKHIYVEVIILSILYIKIMLRIKR